MRSRLQAAAICCLLLPGSAPAFAAVKNPQADAAMRKGIRDTAKSVKDGQGHVARASRIRVRCEPVPRVDDRKPCKGTFRLTLNGRSADYTLRPPSSTFRVSKGAIEYRVFAVSDVKVKGLPRKTGMSGFLQ